MTRTGAHILSSATAHRLPKPAAWLAALLLPLLYACTEAGIDVPGEITPDEPRSAVFMNIGIRLNDVGMPQSRSSRADGPGADDPTLRDPVEGEKMTTLRLLIVRPDGTVEANRYVDRLTSAEQLRYTFSRIRVNPNETKIIYLIANEDAVDTERRRLLGDLDFSSLKEGYWYDPVTGDKIDYPTAEGEDAPVNARYAGGAIFPVVKTEDLATPALDIAAGRQLSTDAPGLLITEKHTIDVGTDDIEREYTMLRAATKMTFNFENNSNGDLKIENLRISGIATRQFVIPRHGSIITDWDSTTGDKIEQLTDDFTVPDADSYPGMAYQTAPLASTLEIAKGAELSLAPFYFPEGKAGENIISFTINGAEFSAPLPYPDDEGINHGLPYSLPRNTHVVVNVSFSLKKVDLVLDVIPFTLIELSPDYGLERDEATGWLLRKDADGTEWLYDRDDKAWRKRDPGTGWAYKQTERGEFVYNPQLKYWVYLSDLTTPESDPDPSVKS